MRNRLSLLIIASAFLILFSCKKDEGINLFSLEQDIEFGLQMKQQIEDSPLDFPLLDPVEFPEAYSHLYRIRDSILSSSEINYRDEFAWEVYLIDNDSTLNAFAVPGGYMYFYTGLIKFLDSEDQFAGVMAHEMAHVDKRHSTSTLTKQYGLSFMASMLLGENQNAYVEIASDLAQGLAGLSFSRKHEYQADEYAVKYMYTTAYDARGVKGFFEKLESSVRTPVFLSTHPSPNDRIEQILSVWESLGSESGQSFESLYQDFKNSLN